jgi:hypothetical protein
MESSQAERKNEGGEQPVEATAIDEFSVKDLGFWVWSELPIEATVLDDLPHPHVVDITCCCACPALHRPECQCVRPRDCLAVDPVKLYGRRTPPAISRGMLHTLSNSTDLAVLLHASMQQVYTRCSCAGDRALARSSCSTGKPAP